MKATFSINNLEELKSLESKIKALPNEAEDIINEYLHTTGADNTITLIKKRMPLSKKNKNYVARFSSGKRQPTTHAKYSDSLRVKPINLGFIVESTSSYWYLVFPALGIGNSYKNMPDDFMNKGLNDNIPIIINHLSEDLMEKLEKRL